MASLSFAGRSLRLYQTSRLPSKFRTTTRSFATTRSLRQTFAPDDKPVNFYRSHGRALFKALTLAFLSYQIAYWAWLTLETEEIKAQKDQEITTLENEVRLLDESRRSHKPNEI